MNSIAIWNKLPREIFQRLTKLPEQEKGRQSVLFQNSSCVNLCRLFLNRQRSGPGSLHYSRAFPFSGIQREMKLE